MDSATAWSQSEFGSAQLGDGRRTRRLVSVAAGVAKDPGGTVTGVFSSAAAREGAYRFLENESIRAEEIGAAHHRSTARRCGEHPWVYVPIDLAHVAVPDFHRRKELGSTSPNSNIKQGLTVLNAMAVSPQGTVLGLLSQQWWARSISKQAEHMRRRRPQEERETWYWNAAQEQSCEQLRKEAPGTKAWFVGDRGADAGWLLHEAVTHNRLVTFRSSYSRRLAGKPKRYLHPTARKARVMASVTTHLPKRAAPSRLDIRACSVLIGWDPERRSRKRIPVPLNVVHIRERGVPKKRRVEWFLLTTAPIDTKEQVLAVFNSYRVRWKIEELHKTWKTGACCAEQSQLRSRFALQRWWTILIAVAARIERLKHLARNEPELSAHVEFTQDEIDAAILLSKTKRWKPGDAPSVHELVALVAQIGGYVTYNKSPPGSITIRRGLDKVTPAAQVLAMTRKM